MSAVAERTRTATATIRRPRITAPAPTPSCSGSTCSSPPRRCSSGPSSPPTSSPGSPPDPEVWPPEPYHLPVFLAGVNTIILVTSSFTVHWATHSIKQNHRAGLVAGLGLTMLLGLTFLLIQIIEYLRIGFSPRDLAFGSTFFGLTGLHGLHVFVGLCLLSMAFLRAMRGHYSPQMHLGVEVPAIYWHFVDVMWIVVYVTVYVI